MLRVLEEREAGAADALFDDALGHLAASSDVDLRLVPETMTRGACAVSGGYLPDQDPPALVVTRSTSLRRQRFTALHELGHHLQQTDFDLGAALLEHPKDALLEEVSCHVFASRILLPDTLVADLTPSAGPDAATVAAYFNATDASRAACCVRAAELLVGGGAVVLLRDDGVVDFAASSSLFPPARGSDQSGMPLFERANARRGDVVEHDRTIITYSTGTSDLLYGQAVWLENYLVMVLKTDNASWKAFAPPRPSTSTFTGSTSAYPTCETCQDSFPRDETCRTCDQARCPRGHCECTLLRERCCPGPCGLTLSRSRFANFKDRSTSCRDCDE